MKCADYQIQNTKNQTLDGFGLFELIELRSSEINQQQPNRHEYQSQPAQ